MLQSRNSGQADNIAELMRKYKELETGMKEILKQMKKRGELESKILNLGMDENLIKNMA